MPDVITILENNVVTTEVAGADVLLPMAIAASSAAADRAEAALAEIEEIASGAPDAPSILNKADKDGANITDAESFRDSLDLTNVYDGIRGDDATRAIPTDLIGSPIYAENSPLFIGVEPLGPDGHSVDGITIDSGQNNPPGHTTRRYAGLASAPTAVTSGMQIGYWDFRGFNDGEFYNVASIDVKVDSGLAFGAGEPPRTGMHFYICGNNDQAREAMRLVPLGGSNGFYGAFGYLEIDGSTANAPRNFGQPRLFAATRLNTYGAIIDGRPDSGLSYGQRIDLNGETAGDVFLSGWSGVGGGYDKKFSIQGNGDINTLGVLRVGTETNPSFADTPQIVVRNQTNDWAFALTADPATGHAYGARFHLLPETSASYGFAVSSGAGSGTFKFSVRGDGSVRDATSYYVGSTKVIGAQGAAIADLTTSATSGSLPTPNGTVTIANAAAPTVVELLEYCVELEAKVEALLARLRAATGHGLIA